MCFDTEKTQAPRDISDREARFLRDKDRADKQYQDGLRAANQGSEPGRPMSDSEIVAELFKYHSPTMEQIPRYSAINQAAKNFAEVVLANCPPCADRSAAIRLLRDARMTANAAIALNGLSL